VRARACVCVYVCVCVCVCACVFACACVKEMVCMGACVWGDVGGGGGYKIRQAQVVIAL
jgi:hypothetical protein